MDNLPDIPVVFPSLPSSRASSVVEEPSQNLLLLRHFLRETRDRLRFTPEQLPIPDDRQLNDLSDSESILFPFVFSSLNALVSMTKQVDTITTQLATVQSIVATLPTSSAIDSRLSLINVALRDLSQRANTAPPVPSAPPRPTIPPTGVVARPAVPPPVPRPRAPPPQKLSTTTRALNRTSPPTILSGAFSTETPALTQTSSLTPGKPTRSVMANTLTHCPSSRAISTPTIPNPNRPTLRPPRLSPPRRGIRRRTLPLLHKSRPSATHYRRSRPPSRSLRQKEGSTLLVLPHPNTPKPL